MPEDEIVRNWDVSLRTPNRRFSTMVREQWLKEEDDDAGSSKERIGEELTRASARMESSFWELTMRESRCLSTSTI